MTRSYRYFPQIQIKDHVKKLKIKGYFGRYYPSAVWHISMEMQDGRKAKLDTTGTMTIGEIVDELINRAEAKK